MSSLGLPEGITACLFDLDGVLTQTAKVHAKACKQMFDGYLHDRAGRTGEPFREFSDGGFFTCGRHQSAFTLTCVR